MKSKGIGSPVSGAVVDIVEINDPVFSMKLVGDGVAIHLDNGNVYAPCSGKVTVVHSTKHAIGITSDNGDDILIHLGLNTSRLDNKHIRLFIHQNDIVQKGDLIARFDYESLPEDIDPVVVLVVTNLTGSEYLEKKIDRHIYAGESIFEIRQGN